MNDLGIAGSAFAEVLLGRDFLARLAGYSWPGNVRELRNHIERCVAFADTSTEPGGMALSPSASGARLRVSSAAKAHRTRSA